MLALEAWLCHLWRYISATSGGMSLPPLEAQALTSSGWRFWLSSGVSDDPRAVSEGDVTIRSVLITSVAGPAVKSDTSDMTALQVSSRALANGLAFHFLIRFVDGLAFVVFKLILFCSLI
ncbi:hypothetical protein F0562_031373 [Nyssa sinensis]|uniref:Secreted protein n=1 Tax=Nyssa sinensis TaxID=561372 RepID=A0A5J5AVC0_9ASTE|nr:hypothetical protein F0562_031373 [Nyssa sinensis]